MGERGEGVEIVGRGVMGKEGGGGLGLIGVGGVGEDSGWMG